jgi:hypothetical protein
LSKSIVDSSTPFPPFLSVHDTNLTHLIYSIQPPDLRYCFAQLPTFQRSCPLRTSEWVTERRTEASVTLVLTEAVGSDLSWRFRGLCKSCTSAMGLQTQRPPIGAVQRTGNSRAERRPFNECRMYPVDCNLAREFQGAKRNRASKPTVLIERFV